MQLPIPNEGGTNRRDLQADYHTALRALQKAASDLAGVWPHARDYPIGCSDLREAEREHADRIRKVHQVIAEIDIIGLSLA